MNIRGTSYISDAAHIRDTVINTGANVTYVELQYSEGQAVAALANNSFDQIWVIDFSFGTDSYAADYVAIANWYQASMPEVICDGRILASYWQNRWSVEGQLLTDNYYSNLNSCGGGLVLGTDHSAFHYSGMNQILAYMGIFGFTSIFLDDPVITNTTHPLMLTPNDLGPTLPNDSSGGFAPYNVQPNGQVIYPVAWTSTQMTSVAISSSIREINTLPVCNAGGPYFANAGEPVHGHSLCNGLLRCS